jgi:hypothetical protein
MAVQVRELKGIAQKVLDTLGVIDYRELQLTYVSKTEGKWRVSFEYEPYHRRFSTAVLRKVGSFAVDVKSGEVEGMWLDRSWK